PRRKYAPLPPQAPALTIPPRSKAKTKDSKSPKKHDDKAKEKGGDGEKGKEGHRGKDSAASKSKDNAASKGKASSEKDKALDAASPHSPVAKEKMKGLETKKGFPSSPGGSLHSSPSRPSLPF
ncbi:unnamed protein product, partial [Chrysoparadoxa australica]